MSSSQVSPIDLLVEAIQNRINIPDLPESAARGALLWVLQNNPPPEDGYTVSPWLLRVLRKGTTEMHRRLGIEEENASSVMGMDTMVAESEPFKLAHACISGMLTELHEDHALILKLLELSNASPTQVAVRLTITPNSVRVRARQARHALYEALMASSRSRSQSM